MNKYSYVYIMKGVNDMSQHQELLCDEACLHSELLEQSQKNIPDDDTLITLSDLFKVLGDMTRVKILSALLKNELCVCDLSEIIGMGQSAVSHQLRVLRASKIVKYRREGKSIFYSIDDDHIRMLFEIALSHINEE